MEIYIEYVLIDNLIINALIGVLTLYCQRFSIKWGSVALSSIFGTMCSVLFPVIKANLAIILLLKVMCGLFMVYFLKKYQSKRQYFRSLMIFLLVTVVLGGVCFMLLFLIEGNFSNAILLNYQEGVPLGLIILAISLSVFGLVRFTAWHQRFKIQNAFSCSIKIYTDKNVATARAFLDSGNRLFDPLTNLPIILIDMGVLARLFGGDLMESLMGDSVKGLEKVRAIPMETQSGSGKLMIFKPQKIEIYLLDKVNILYDVMVGISYRGFSEGVEALLNPAICN